MQMLIDEQSDSMIGGQLAQHFPDSALPMDHAVTGARSNAFEHVVESGIVERACEHRNRSAQQRMRDRLHFPISEMTGEKQDTSPPLVRVPDAFLSLDLDECQHLVV